MHQHSVLYRGIRTQGHRIAVSEIAKSDILVQLLTGASLPSTSFKREKVTMYISINRISPFHRLLAALAQPTVLMLDNSKCVQAKSVSSFPFQL